MLRLPRNAEGYGKNIHRLKVAYFEVIISGPVWGLADNVAQRHGVAAEVIVDLYVIPVVEDVAVTIIIVADLEFVKFLGRRAAGVAVEADLAGRPDVIDVGAVQLAGLVAVIAVVVGLSLTRRSCVKGIDPEA